jgi:hypothetical protein
MGGFEERISKDYTISRNTEANEAPEVLPIHKYGVDVRHASTYPRLGHEDRTSSPASQAVDNATDSEQSRVGGYSDKSRPGNVSQLV